MKQRFEKYDFDFPKAEITSEEKVRRAMAEAQRLASLAPGEWRLWIDRAAERLSLPRATLEGLISAIIKDSERKAREDKAKARRQEERVRREQRERKREQQGIDKKAERKSTRPGSLNWRNDLMRTLPPFAMISRCLLAWRAGLHQQIHGMSNPGRIRSRLVCSFRRSALRRASTS
jgi:hypothetical protein